MTHNRSLQLRQPRTRDGEKVTGEPPDDEIRNDPPRQRIAAIDTDRPAV